MSGSPIQHLVDNGWAEPLDADDAEVLGYWRRAVESFEDASAPRVSRTGQFKHLYDAARQAWSPSSRRTGTAPLRANVCRLLNSLGDEIRRARPAIAARVRKLRCPAAA
jgi:hypothetical protein